MGTARALHMYTARTLTHALTHVLSARCRRARARHRLRRAARAATGAADRRATRPLGLPRRQDHRRLSCARAVPHLSPRGARASTAARRPVTATALVVRAVHAVHAVRHVRHVVALCAQNDEDGWVGGGGAGGLTWCRGGLAVRNRCEPWAVQATRLRGAHDAPPHEPLMHVNNPENESVVRLYLRMPRMMSLLCSRQCWPLTARAHGTNRRSSAAVFKL